MSIFESNYEKLKRYYPAYYQRVKEMDAIWQYGGKALDALEAATDRAVDNTYVKHSDMTAIARYERFLSITPDRTKTLQARQQLVLSYFVGFGKLSATKIKTIVSVFTDAPCEVEFRNSCIYIILPLETRDSMDRINLRTSLIRRIPAHLELLFWYLAEIICIENANTLRTTALTVKFGVSNNMIRPVMFDGEKIFDGSYLFDQALGGRLQLHALNIKAQLQNPQSARVTLRKDTYYEFGGAYSFDGVRRFNAAITEEEL